MQVIKFGGSSVASAENINKVVDIVKSKAGTGKVAVVVSALGGITDLLLQCANLAATGNETYKTSLQEIETRHLNTVKELIPVTQQSSVLSAVKKMCNEIEDICNGIFLLGELSERTKDKIVSYGELLSSQIIAAKLKATGLDVAWKDSRELIQTDSNFGAALVNFSKTNEAIKKYFAAVIVGELLVPINSAGFSGPTRFCITAPITCNFSPSPERSTKVYKPSCGVN